MLVVTQVLKCAGKTFVCVMPAVFRSSSKMFVGLTPDATRLVCEEFSGNQLAAGIRVPAEITAVSPG